MSATVLSWLPEVLERAGLKVARVDGWEDRRRPGAFGPIKGILCHHTAGPHNGKNMPSLGLVTQGRADLAGPLAQLCLGRDGTYYVVSAGRCNHAGPGVWKGVDAGNTHFIGIEAENAGTPADPWPDVQMDAYYRGVAAILRHLGLDPGMCAGHKEYAPGRKIDPSFDMNVFRARVKSLMAGGHAPSLIPPSEPHEASPDRPAPRPTIRRNDRGNRVQELQTRLGLQPDGVFGGKTEAAVRQFQRQHGLAPDGIVGPRTWAALDENPAPPALTTPAPDAGRPDSSALRQAWADYEGAEEQMTLIPFGPDKIRVAPPTCAAWEALARVLDAHEYAIRGAETDSYNDRSVKGGAEKSLHAYGIALDLNWTTNPYRDHPGERPIRFSQRDTQDARAEEVRLGKADTDMTQAMIDDVLAIRTPSGQTVFAWGGSWLGFKEPMHFQINLTPADLAAGLDDATVKGSTRAGLEEARAPTVLSTDPAPLASPPGPAVPHRVNAPSGLTLRSGPSPDFSALRILPAGARVYVTGTTNGWASVNLDPNGAPAGYMFAKYLSPVTDSELAATPTPAGGADVLASITADQVARMFPRTRKASIQANLPYVLDGLRNQGLADRTMALMALATIRAETEGFVPISEGVSRYNTRSRPFDLYDAGTSIGRDLGNTQPGDGPKFKGRGYVQLTGRDNYQRIGRRLNLDLTSQPDLANDPKSAGLILARFLKNNESAIRAALAQGDLKAARRKVNGGIHGFDRFQEAYTIGLKVLP